MQRSDQSGTTICTQQQKRYSVGKYLSPSIGSISIVKLAITLQRQYQTRDQKAPTAPGIARDLAPNSASFLTASGHYWGRKPLGSRNWPVEVGRGSKGRRKLHCTRL